MKKSLFCFASLVFVSFVMSCNFFSKPLYSFSRDISGVVSSMSTADLVGNVDSLSSDPKKAADVLNVLADRDQDEISNLPKDDKEKLLNAGTSAILPVSQLGDMVEQLTKEGETVDMTSIMDSLTQGAPTVNTKALETVLEDEEILKSTDASTLALSAASLIVNTVKTEADDTSSFETKMKDFQEVAGTTSAETFNKEDFENQLQKKGFSAESASALSAAMGVTNVLTGERKDDTASISFGGMSIADLLDQMSGGKK